MLECFLVYSARLKISIAIKVSSQSAEAGVLRASLIADSVSVYCLSASIPASGMLVVALNCASDTDSTALLSWDLAGELLYSLGTVEK